MKEVCRNVNKVKKGGEFEEAYTQIHNTILQRFHSRKKREKKKKEKKIFFMFTFCWQESLITARNWRS